MSRMGAMDTITTTLPLTRTQSVPNVAVLIPCYNEGKTIYDVVKDFQAALPGARVYVYDNNSTDETIREAERAGAEISREPMQGKGWVVRRMFANIHADYYVLVDGDGTYDASIAPEMINMADRQNLAMVVGRRVHESARAYRPGHVIGNKIFTTTVAKLFGTTFTDVFSGYRVFSRPFVKSFPVFSDGFEIETELTVHALTLGLQVAEIATHYSERPEGSVSKLNTYRDGMRIFWTILKLMKNEKPLQFFAASGLVFLLTALVLAYPIVMTFLQTGLVPRFPTAILSTGLAVYALILFGCGLILDTVTKGRRELKMLSYLSAMDRFQNRRPFKAMASRMKQARRAAMNSGALVSEPLASVK
jgi:glycosyltransferase involved in cell wall biosynthesis